ncbi:hypothetical protein MMC24_001554 [Lignoscripta atroalba]|nr:hypothetical protein [Lignoscripta atroalba]
MAFNILPIELNQQIVSFLPDDKDLRSFDLTCRQTHDAISSQRSSIWRLRFAQLFDLLPHKSSIELKRKYQCRRKIMQKSCYFKEGHEPTERRYLELFRDLIVESFANANPDRKSIAKPTSNNLEQLLRLVKKSDLLHKLFYPQSGKGIPDPLLQTIQLLLTHWSLDLSLYCPTYGYHISQKAVYSHPKDCPLFLDQHMRVVNVEFLLHIANFFKYHITHKDEGILNYDFELLSHDKKPKAWQKSLEQGLSKPGSKWMGSYAYLHDPADMVLIRDIEAGDHVFIDSIDTDTTDGFQTLTLDFDNPMPWPLAFEHHLRSIPPPALVHALKNPLLKPRPSSEKATTSPTHVQGPGLRQQDSPRRSFAPTTTPITPPATPKPPPNALLFPPKVFPHPKPKPRLDYLPFTGSGIDAEPFHCAGNIHPLPPQQGIPGWQRITMMKYFAPRSSVPSTTATSPPPANPFNPSFFSSSSLSSSTSSSSSSSPPSSGFFTPPSDVPGFDFDNLELEHGCWAYEGVVLPGGMVMLGRWWSPMDGVGVVEGGGGGGEEGGEGEGGGERLCTGPWVFWNVD